jgi:glycosyltransferase involved in cell wall biosynthesis
MIVKNERENLSRCLASVKPYVHEMIVVDTGSEDGTQEIASNLERDLNTSSGAMILRLLVIMPSHRYREIGF